MSFSEILASLRPPASPPETLRVTMWAGLRDTHGVAKWLELHEALRAGLGVRFFRQAAWREVFWESIGTHILVSPSQI
jgi:hypothetical protein